MTKNTSNNPAGRVRSASIIAANKRKEKARRLALQVGIGFVVVVAVLATTIAVLKSQDGGTAPTPPNLTAQGGIVVGDPAAPVTVTVVEDFGCPFCKTFESEAATLLASYEAGTQVKVEYRGIAFLDRAFDDAYSSRALNASACVAADTTPTIWKRFHQALFAQQPAEGGPGLDDEVLAAAAVGAGATADGTRQCILDGTYRDWTKAQTDATLGSNGVEGTPTVFVNGTKLEETSVAALDAAVTRALS